MSLLLLPVSVLISCSSANNKPVLIGFSSDSNSVVFSGINPAGLLQMRNTAGVDTAFSQFISVLETPSERDSLGIERMLKGEVRFTDSTVVFLPAVPFVAGKDYLVISYLNAQFANPTMIASGQLNHAVKPYQVILSR